MPRSPSRDLVDRFAGNRGYFHRADRLRKWKNGLTLAAVGLTVGWVVVELARPSAAATAHTHGPLAGPHATWDSNCEACHRPHAPRELFGNPFSVFRVRDRWHDLTCEKCHRGPAHHATAADTAFHDRCSNCHHDHQGRGFSLVRLADDHCVRCHQNLPAAHTAGQSAFAPAVTNFAKDHPEFRALTEHPPGSGHAERRLKFSHALHMTPGLVYDANDQHPWTPETLGQRFGAAVGQRYAAPGAKPTDPVSLACAACHQLVAGPGVSPRTDGAYYLPVNFDAHCKACHPIQTPTATSGGAILNEFTAPHRKQPAELKELLRGEYAARLATPGHPALATPVGPGGRLDPPAPAVKAFGDEIDRLTDATMKALLLGMTPVDTGKADAVPAPAGGFACGKCHYANGPEVARLPDRSVWFPHATFNHASHRGLTCASCHPGTGAAFAPGGRVKEREPVLISGVKSCQACHAPTGTPIDLSDGTRVAAAGVRHNCTDCHRYHNGDRPMQGRGAHSRDPAAPLDLGEFFRGMKQPPG